MVRAFIVAWRALVAFYGELFLLAGLSVLWWATGGVLVAAAALFAFAMLREGGPLWLAPLLAIPAGPATAALANVGRQAARDLHADRGTFWEGLRLYWRAALATSAASMVLLALLILDWQFWGSQRNQYAWAFSFFWLYLAAYWLVAQLYLYPVLVALKRPNVLEALRTAAVVTFANPFFSLLMLAIAVLLTGLSIALAIVLPLGWPAIMVLLGELSLQTFMARVRGPEGSDPVGPAGGERR